MVVYHLRTLYRDGIRVMFSVGDRVRCLCHWNLGTVDEVQSPYRVSVLWDYMKETWKHGFWIDTCVLELYGEFIMQKHLIKRVADDGSFSYLQAGRRTLCWYSLEEALSVVSLFNANREDKGIYYEVEVNGGECGIIVDKQPNAE